MAKAGTLALWGVSVATLVGIAYVHYGQKVERAVSRGLHVGTGRLAPSRPTGGGGTWARLCLGTPPFPACSSRLTG